MRPIRFALALALWLPAGAAGQPALLPAPSELDARALAERAEDSLRSSATYLEATVVIAPKQGEPERLKLRAWDDRANRRLFLRVLEPPKDAGIGFLKVHPNLWRWVPSKERMKRIAPARLLEPWKDSGFSNDDLVNASSRVDDYGHRLLGVDPDVDGRRAYVVEYVRRPEAQAVWPRIVARLDAEKGTPLRMEYFGEDGKPLRTLRFEEIREVQSRPVPHRWRVTRAGEPGESRLEIREIRFDQVFDDAIFTTRHLRQAK